MKTRLPVVQEQASSIQSDGSRNFVHPADVSGRFTRLRYVFFAVLIVVYIALPFIQIGGHPAVFLDVAARKFYLFGGTFNAQDFWLVFFLLSGAGLALIVVTTLWGRVWCGYACPQTVFLEGIYRRIERWIEGPRAERLRRNAARVSWSKVWRKTLKHGLFALVSVVLAHFFLSYFVSLPSLFAMIQQRPTAHIEAFVWMAAMSGILYFNFAWFREQLCLVVCPYGRLQSAMIDSDSVIIGYDVGRGEPRGKVSDPNAGDCIACNRCVVVCPTGIDIRNGLQMECIGCAACIDACDEIMRKVDRPEGLIRYDTQRVFAGEPPRRRRRSRLVLYAGLTLAWLLVAAVAFGSRTDFEANVLRPTGAPYSVVDGAVRNPLNIHLVNKRGVPAVFRLAPAQDDGPLHYVFPLPRVELRSLSGQYVPVLVSVPTADLKPGLRAAIRISVEGEDGDARVVTAPIIGPRTAH